MDTGTTTPAPREQYRITCHCGGAAQTITLLPPPPPPINTSVRTVTVCHCDECRHVSGVLCATYLEVEKPGSLNGLVKHIDHDGDGASNVDSSKVSTVRWFCGVCGSHVFAQSIRLKGVGEEEVGWAVATGCLVGRVDVEEGEEADMSERSLFEVRQGNVARQEDGRSMGLSGVLSFPSVLCDIGGLEGGSSGGKRHWAMGGGGMPPSSSHGAQMMNDDEMGEQFLFAANNGGDSRPVAHNEDLLRLHCLCNRVSLAITRPDEASTKPWSPQPDLMFPYHSTPKDVLDNKQDLKWWIRPSQNDAEDGKRGEKKKKRYLAGTCTCRSCRLISGFEVQTWAFVPRTNIFVCQADATNKYILHPLDFTTSPTSSMLCDYESSPGVFRDFCPDCGATVFWHNQERPDVIDLSAGLIDTTRHQSSDAGLPAVEWLDWWTERVSFVEHAGSGRTGEVVELGRRIAEDLEKGLRTWRQRRQGGEQEVAG